MGDHFVTNRIDDTTFDIDLLINDDPNKSEMDILLDDFLGGSDDELDVVSYLSRQEYSKALSCNDSREMEDSGVIVAQDIRSFTWQPLPSNRIGFGA